MPPLYRSMSSAKTSASENVVPRRLEILLETSTLLQFNNKGYRVGLCFKRSECQLCTPRCPAQDILGRRGATLTDPA